MNKTAQAIVEESVKEKIQVESSDHDQLYLKLQKEAEIRMQLDEFARELSQARQKRNEH